MDITKENIKKRKTRIKQTAEVFTPDELVNEILDRFPDEVWEEGKTYLDPACGNGNFLVHILLRKIDKGHNSTDALKSIYGLDIMKDNIIECMLRLLKIISIFEDIKKEHIEIVFTYIRWLNPVKWPRGTLDYDMSFKNNYDPKNVDEWYKKILTGELVDLDIKDIDTPDKLDDIFEGKIN